MVCKYFSNKNLFKRHKSVSQQESNINFFWTLSPYHEGALCVAKFLHTLTLKKWYAQNTSGCGTVQN